jgi:hypothetical protein
MTQQDFTGVPLTVALELAAAVIILLYGELPLSEPAIPVPPHCCIMKHAFVSGAVRVAAKGQNTSHVKLPRQNPDI